jgi:hypothetical protein
MHLDQDSVSHWHGRHREKGQVKPPPFRRHLRGWPAIAEDAVKIGVEIINASPTSAIQAFRKVSVRELL